MDILGILTLLLSSFGVLALIAIFRWQAHDNYLNARMEVASNYAFRFLIDNDNKPSPNTGPTTYNEIIAFLDDVCAIIEEREKRDKNPLPIVMTLLKDILQNQKLSITKIANSTHIIRRYFNWPFFYLCFVVPLSMLPQIPDIIKYCFLYVGIAVMISASYSLFNFSYNPEDHNGFGKLFALFKRTNSQGS